VLVGGMVFPLFATFYTGCRCQQPHALGAARRWVFWLMFLGFNITFFPMHLTGMLGMPRRVWTYPAELGWDTLNLVSTAGSYMLGAGILLFVIDLARTMRPGDKPENPWGAGTLEWLPNDVYSTRSIPQVTSREPLWDQPGIVEDVREGRWFLPGAPTGGRETIVTSPVEAKPQFIIQMPGPGWTPPLAALFTAAFFLLLTVKLVTVAVVCGVLAIVFCLVWAWGLDPGPSKGMASIGGGIELPTYVTGPTSHSWWAMVVLMFVAGSLYLSYVFSYLFLWTVSPEVWAPGGAPPLPWVACWRIGAAARARLRRHHDRAPPAPGAGKPGPGCGGCNPGGGALHGLGTCPGTARPLADQPEAFAKRLRRHGLHGRGPVRPARFRPARHGPVLHRPTAGAADRQGQTCHFRQSGAALPLRGGPVAVRAGAGARLPEAGRVTEFLR